MTRIKLYLLLALACSGAYAWILVSIISPMDGHADVCLIKSITGFPCPSCGSTRAVLALLNGDIQGAFFWNPIGFIILTVLFISPVWIIYDVLFKKSTLLDFYSKVEILARQRRYAAPLILMVAANWIWNVYKDL